MVTATQGFSNLALSLSGAATAACWVQDLGQMRQLAGFQSSGISRYTTAANPSLTLQNLTVQSHQFLVDGPALAHNPFFQASSFAFFESTDPMRMGAALFLGIDNRTIAHDQDLLGALRTVTRQSHDREYAIEQGASESYNVYRGTENSVLALGKLLLHTHCDSTALPSEADLHSFAKSRVHDPSYYSLIYSRPENEHQISLIQPQSKEIFDVWHWSDRYDLEKRIHITVARHFRLHAPNVVDHYPEVVEVTELSLSGESLGYWQYRSHDRSIDRHIQDFWWRVLEDQKNRL